MRLREKIDGGDALDLVATVDEPTQITRKDGRITRDVGDDSRPQFYQIQNRLLFSSGARRIK
jgi:hypothetical protein